MTYMGNEIGVDVITEKECRSRHKVAVTLNGKDMKHIYVSDVPRWAVEKTWEKEIGEATESVKSLVKTVVENWEATKDVGGLFEEAEEPNMKDLYKLIDAEIAAAESLEGNRNYLGGYINALKWVMGHIDGSHDDSKWDSYSAEITPEEEADE